MNQDNHKKEEWLSSLKEKMSHYQEPVPQDGWAELETRLPEIKPVAPRIRWTRLAAVFSTAAAVALLFWALLPLHSNLQTAPESQPLAVTLVPEARSGEQFPGQPDAGTKKRESDVFIAENKPVKRKVTGAMQRSDAVVADSHAHVLPADIAAVKERIAVVPSTEEENRLADHSVQQKAQTPKEQQKDDRPAQMTWEEYLNENRDAEKDSPARRKGNDWLALSVGNNGVGTFNPRVGEVATAPLMQQASITQLDGVKDAMFFKRPENLAISPGVEAIDLEYKHKQPLSFGVKFGKNLSNKFALETGLVYSLLRSDIENLQKDKTVRQTLHYLGIPIRFNWNFVQKPKYAVYTGLGGMVEKCIYGELDNEKLKIKSVQTSLNFSVGAQYKFSPVVGIYFEPGLSYYLGMKEDGSLGTTGNGVQIKSIHSENPLGFTLQAGFRFSF